jgi:hypothetical protein
MDQDDDTVSLFGEYDADQANFDESIRRASGWEDLYQGDDGYVSFELYSYSATNSPVACVVTTRLSSADIVSLNTNLCNCPSAACSNCKGSTPFIHHKEWLLDSGASNHFTPLISDFISYKRFPEKETVWTAGPPIELLGIETALADATPLPHANQISTGCLSSIVLAPPV